MTAPNIIYANVINGNTVGVLLSSTANTTILSNAASSNHVYKINTINIANLTGNAALITIRWYDNATIASGNGYAIAANISVPGQTTLNLIDKTSQYYLQENQAIGATANVANSFTVTCSYEDIS